MEIEKTRWKQSGKRWIPLGIAVLLIFAFTFQNGYSSAALTVHFQEWLRQWLGDTSWNNYKLMRKLAHIPEYFLLGLGSAYAIRCWWKAGIFCAGISLLDQCVKGILPRREFDFTDMPFDFIGYALGIALMIAILKLVRILTEKRTREAELTGGKSCEIPEIKNQSH